MGISNWDSKIFTKRHLKYKLINSRIYENHYYSWHLLVKIGPDSKVHGANMGSTWVLSTQVGPMLAPWILLSGWQLTNMLKIKASGPEYKVMLHGNSLYQNLLACKYPGVGTLDFHYNIIQGLVLNYNMTVWHFGPCVTFRPCLCDISARLVWHFGPLVRNEGKRVSPYPHINHRRRL